MANRLHANTEIIGWLNVDGSISVKGIQLDGNGISKTGNGATHHLDNSQAYHSFSKQDWQGVWNTTSMQVNSTQVSFNSSNSSTWSSFQITPSQIYLFTRGYVSFNAGNVGSIEMNNYQGTSTAVTIQSNQDNLRLKTAAYYSNISTSTLTENRVHNLPDEDGTLATKEWVLAKLAEIQNGNI